jgi:DNA-directed RNA polymerase subunit M/transcription elongation factor TFIIS
VSALAIPAGLRDTAPRPDVTFIEESLRQREENTSPAERDRTSIYHSQMVNACDLRIPCKRTCAVALRSSAQPSVPQNLKCARCHKIGFIRLETVIKAQQTRRLYQCGKCGYAWSEDEQPNDADRRKRLTQRRAVARNDRRQP